jgi:hypothetical protein
MYPHEIFSGVAQERIMKALKDCTFFHLLREDISNIAFTTDVGDCEGAISHQFLNRVLFVFNVTIAFSGHFLAPLDASIMLAVKVSRDFCTGDGVT